MKLSKFSVSIVYEDNRSIDISDTVLNLNITENIFGNLEGKIEIVDGVGMLDNAITKGNLILLEFEYFDHTVKHSFHLDGVNAIDVTTNLTKKTYVINLKSIDTFINTAQLISKSFKGTSTDIIKSIFDGSFSKNLKVLANSITKGHYIAPNISPNTAIKQVKSQAYDIDSSPFFMFERLVDSKNAFLTSLTQINGQSTMATISPSIQNADTVENQLGNIGQPASVVVHSDNDNISYKVANGVYGKTIVNADISKSSVDAEVFGEMSNSGSSLNLLRMDMYDNDSKPLLHTNDQINICNMTSMLNMIFSIRVTAYECQAIPGLGVGNKVKVLLNKQQQTQSRSGKFSGVYLVSKIIHTIKDNDYTQTIELAKE
jgi:hypothetical protein